MRILASVVLFLGTIGLAPDAAAQRHRDDAVECTSRDYRFTRCGVNWYDARLLQQTSDSRCTRGRTWGVDRVGLWVDKGCGGVFGPAGALGGRDYGRDHGRDWRPGRDWDGDFRIRCASHDYRYNFCAADVGGGGRVYVSANISNAACIEGRNWGWNRAGVWVNGGCEAEFVIERRWR